MPHAREQVSVDCIPPDQQVQPSLQEFFEEFPLQGEGLYNFLYQRHADSIQTQKQSIAAGNLEKILCSTFEISSRSGFEKMSLRDLSAQSGMSMGAIYSCINKKEDIALMVADAVRESAKLVHLRAMQSESAWLQLQHSILLQLYVTTLLQPWYFFLYFETRSLPDIQQQQSKQIEIDAISTYETLIQRGISDKEFSSADAATVANMIVVMIEDWYLKPWKTNLSTSDMTKQEKIINDYHGALMSMLRSLLTGTRT